MKKYFIHMFEYNDWANNLILKSFDENPGVTAKNFSLFSHIIISQILWSNRIKNEPYSYKDFWQMLTIEEMHKLCSKSSIDWITLVGEKSEMDLQSKYSYTNSRGIRYTNTLAQIITHVINHSTYHRAQIASQLRNENIQPPLTDYIAFFR